ncbi:ABC transporter substrate-binding protein [Kitasatospora sp. NPDC088346]|uniref:ABC transporter substrate-binding protein n=1 Tax=Kitasatospora sp. NPDC088346 TaxID=3364073 RepID=UPI0037FD9070
MRSRVLCGIAAAAALLTATACSTTGGGSGSEAATGATGTASAGAFPVEVADCAGKKTTFAGPARRIVTSNGSALEMLLQLGAGDRVIGTGFPPGKGTLPAAVADQGAKVPVLGEMGIAKEKLLGSGADTYVDTFGSMDMMGGAGGGAPTEAEFAAAGIRHVYLLSTACTATAKGPRTDLAEVEQDIRRLGAVTGTGAKAEELTTAMESRVKAVTDALKDLPAERRPGYFFFDFDAGTKQPVALCGRQVANAVITLAGARNVFADCDSDFRPVSWEDVVAKNPDWIQLGVRDRGSEAENTKAYAEAEAFLREFPATRALPAVQQGHFLRIGSEVTTIAGTRNADTVQRIAATVHPDLVRNGS